MHGGGRYNDANVLILMDNAGTLTLIIGEQCALLPIHNYPVERDFKIEKQLPC